MLITIHFAQTLDGRIASGSGDSQWIGGAESLRLAHELRASHDAVLVGLGTIIADDPQLTTRLVDGPSPLRVVADSRLRIPVTAKVLQDGAAPTMVVTTDQAPEDRRHELARLGVDVAVVGRNPEGHIDVEDLTRVLAGRGIRSLLVEGGAEMITSMLRARLCDRLVVCIAPRVLGKGIEAIGDLGIERLRDALTFSRVSVERYGDDIILDGQLAGVVSLAG